MTLYKPTFTTTKLLLHVSLLSATHSGFANWFNIDDLFASMEQDMMHMRQEMQRMQQSMQTITTNQCKGNSQKPLSSQITQDPSGNGIILTITNLRADSVDAQIDEHSNMLRVTTPTTHIKIASRNSTIAIDIDDTIEQQQENKKDGAVCSYLSAQSRSYSKQGIAKPVDLEKTKIDYNPESQQLVLFIEYADNSKVQGKKLPVTILKTPDKKEPIQEK